MHTFLTGLFEGVVLGIAIALLIASLELRNAGRNNFASTHSHFDEEPVGRANAREPVYAGSLNAELPSNRANDSEIDRPIGRPFPIGLTLS
jgi:hypothetical protein